MQLDRNAEAIAHAGRSAAGARTLGRAALGVLILVSGLALPASGAQAQEGTQPPPVPSARGPRMGRDWSLDPDELVKRMTQKLDLTAAQQDQIKGLVARFRSGHGDALARARELHKAMRAAFGSGTRPSREDLEALANQYGNPGRELVPAVRQLRDDAISMLGPEQRRKLADLRASWQERCRGGHGPGGGPGRQGFVPRPTPPVPAS